MINLLNGIENGHQLLNTGLDLCKGSIKDFLDKLLFNFKEWINHEQCFIKYRKSLLNQDLSKRQIFSTILEEENL